MKKIFIISSFIILISGSFFFLINQRGGSMATDIPVIKNFIASPTPMPFEETTIPYLRNRKYQSALTKMDKYQDNGSYTSYLASYDSDGLKINGLLTIPTGEKPGAGWPAVILVHGYIPPGQYQTTGNYMSWVEYPARNGLAVFKIDLRGHGQSEGEPGGAYYSSDYIIDTLNAYSALVNTDFIDPDKIGLWGHSMGGNVVFRSFVTKQNIPKVVIWAGAVYSYEDMAKYRINDNSYRPPQVTSARQRDRQRIRDLYGEFSKNNPFWQMLTPTNYLDGITGEIEIHHAIDDNVVNIGYSRDLMKILDNTDIPHRLFEYDSGGHNISNGSFNIAMQRTAEFLKK